MARKGRKKSHYIVKRDLEHKIWQACCCLELSGGRPTVASVAKLLGYSVGSHMRGTMNKMVDEQRLLKYEEMHWNGRKAFVYLVPQKPMFKNADFELPF